MGKEEQAFLLLNLLRLFCDMVMGAVGVSRVGSFGWAETAGSC